MNAALHMRRKSDWSPTASVVALIADMLMPSDAELQQIVEALARKLSPHPRLRHAVDELGDVHAAIEDAAPAKPEPFSLECEACAGTGGERAPCKPCGGRGVESAFAEERS